MIFIALGANLPSRYGDACASLLKAVECLDEHPAISVVAQGGIYVSAPVPISDQPWFHNTVVAIETQLAPLELLSALHAIEDGFGRVRSVRNEARVLDLDIIAYHELVLEEGASIPHPRMHERAFVLFPLQDICDDWRHPITKKAISTLISELPQGQDIKLLEARHVQEAG